MTTIHKLIIKTTEAVLGGTINTVMNSTGAMSFWDREATREAHTEAIRDRVVRQETVLGTTSATALEKVMKSEVTSEGVEEMSVDTS